METRGCDWFASTDWILGIQRRPHLFILHSKQQILLTSQAGGEWRLHFKLRPISKLKKLDRRFVFFILGVTYFYLAFCFHTLEGFWSLIIETVNKNWNLKLLCWYMYWINGMEWESYSHFMDESFISQSLEYSFSFWYHSFSILFFIYYPNVLLNVFLDILIDIDFTFESYRWWSSKSCRMKHIFFLR